MVRIIIKTAALVYGILRKSRSALFHRKGAKVAEKKEGIFLGKLRVLGVFAVNLQESRHV
jgi:hypothetical protein